MADVQETDVTQPAPRTLFYVPKRTNVQLDKVRQHFGSVDASQLVLPDDLRFVFLCFTQRSGSTYLAQLIASGGGYNVPREYLNPDSIRSRSAKRKLSSFADYVADVIERDSRQERLFIKATPLHLGMLEEAGLLGRIVDRSDFVLIERGDKLGQAISFAIARGTGKYTSNMPARKTEADLVFDRALIVKLLNGLVESYKQFDMFFGMNGIVPVSIAYEQLISTPEAALRLISGAIGVADFTMKPAAIQNARQAGDLNAAWRAMFLRGEGLLP